MPKNNNQYYSTTPQLPAQAIHSSKKTPKWAHETIDAIDAMGSLSLLNGRLNNQNKQTNYNLVNGIFDPQDFKYVTDPYNIGVDPLKMPAQLRDINLIGTKIAGLKGDELENPFEFTAIGVGGEVVNAIEDIRKEIIATNVAAFVRQTLGREPRQDQQGNIIPPEDPERVIRNRIKSYKDIREVNANRLLRIFWQELDLKEKFNEGLQHGLTASEEIYYVGIIGGKPGVRVVNPLGFDFDRSPELRNIEDSDWAKEERYLSVGQIIDEYGEFLTQEQIKDIELGKAGSGINSRYFYPEFGYHPVDLKIHLENYGDVSRNNKPSYTRVIDTVWKSRKKIGFVRSVTGDGEVEETVVDDTFSLSPAQKEAGVTITWRWINVVYKGTRIGSDIYVDISELPYQLRSADNPSECKLPYVGKVYNGLNSVATSFVDMLKPHQYLYNIIWYRLELELAKAKGKAVIMDLAQLPKSEGIDISEWIHYLDNAGVMFINSFEEGEGINAGKTSAFNQFTEVDRAASQVIGQYISILTKIENLFDTISGLNPQRMGQVQASETATGVERSVRQSNTITAPIFYIHDVIKKNVLTQLLEVAKVAYSDGKKGRFYVDETYTEMLNIDGAIFADSDYAVYITNGALEKKKLETVEQAAMAALQAASIKLREYVSVINSPSFAEKISILEQAEIQVRAEQMEQQVAQNRALLEVEQERTQREMQKQDREDARAQLAAETQIATAQIKALGFAQDQDLNNDNIPDVLQVERVSLDKQKLALEQQKETNKQEIEKKKLELEKRKIDTQLKVAKENKNRFDTKSKD